MYAELIDLLTCRLLESHEREEIEKQILAASANPEYEWAQGDEILAMAASLRDELYDYGAISDKIDEAHEQIQEMFDYDFPDFPDEIFKECDGTDLRIYFKWLNDELAQRAIEDGAYEAIIFDAGEDDRICIFIPYRKDTNRILELAAALGFRMSRPADYFYYA